MDLKCRVDLILANDDLDEWEETKCEKIESLISLYGWEAIQEIMINILLDRERQVSDYEVIAQVFFGACLDNRDIYANRVIALLYHRLPNDEGSCENNLAWSIVCKLKKVSYLSDYNPLKDLEIIQEISNLDLTL